MRKGKGNPGGREERLLRRLGWECVGGASVGGGVGREEVGGVVEVCGMEAGPGMDGWMGGGGGTLMYPRRLLIHLLPLLTFLCSGREGGGFVLQLI